MNGDDFDNLNSNQPELDAKTLLKGMLRAESYPHQTEQICLRETHISWVFLTGQVAYKVKKPVDLGFADFSTLPLRRRFCLQELERNRKYSSGIYLGVVGISLASDVPEDNQIRVDSENSAVEYAVKMRQFDESQLGTNLVARAQLDSSDLDDLAIRIGDLHLAATRDPKQSWGTPERIAEAALDNIRVLRDLIADSRRLDQLEQIESWTRDQLGQLNSFFQDRRRDGFVRECHGDLHLGNLVRWQDRLTPFDCIEFNPDFFWIDVTSEVAFLMMDLEDHGCSDLAWRFINVYLERTGDYAGLRALPFYLVYRAMVRAKVADLRAQQAGVAKTEKHDLEEQWHAYLDMACRYLQPRPISLTITHGVSGSGKSHGSQPLISQEATVRIRSDVERKRLYGVQPGPNENRNPPGQSMYSSEATERTYQHLADLTRSILHSGCSVVVDATFLLRHQRQQFRELAEEMGVPFQILAFQAEPETLRQRLRARRQAGSDASDADENVLEMQLQSLEQLTENELRDVV
jgi:uncharacterized protein